MEVVSEMSMAVMPLEPSGLMMMMSAKSYEREKLRWMSSDMSTMTAFPLYLFLMSDIQLITLSLGGVATMKDVLLQGWGEPTGLRKSIPDTSFSNAEFLRLFLPNSILHSFVMLANILINYCSAVKILYVLSL